MELTDLLGVHELSGVDFNHKSIKGWGGFEDCQCVNFVLDGITYTAVEDPDDGYRSTMREIAVSDFKVENMFAPIEVEAKWRPDSSTGFCEVNDVLEFYKVGTDELILAVGTGNTNDYYPYWVAEFYPENIGEVKAQ